MGPRDKCKHSKHQHREPLSLVEKDPDLAITRTATSLTADISMDSETISSSLKFGGVSACSGLLYGGASGILKSSKHPIVHSVSHSIYWGVWGTSLWWLRSNIVHLHYQDNATQKQLGYASAISGGLSGGAVTKLMGGKFTPGAVVFSLLAYLGQGSWNMVERWHLSNQDKKESRSILQRMADSKWVPLRSLSDDDFKQILNEKILSIEVEIALLDDKIQSLEDERAAAAVARQKDEQTSQDGGSKA